MQDTFAQEYQLFCSTAPWLYPYAVFITLKKHNQMASWTQWPKEQREWIRNRRFSLKEFEEEIRYEQFLQFIFYKQWNQVKAYANAHGVEIMGDLPFYVGLDSADVWQNQEDFLLDPQEIQVISQEYRRIISVTTDNAGEIQSITGSR